MIRTTTLCLAIVFALAAPSSAQEDGGDRFVIPPEAMSPLRRSTRDGPRVARPAPTDTIPTILRDESALPAAVQRTRERILEAARSGELKALRSLLGSGDQATQLTFDELESDPISFLLTLSGDPAGHEVLAIIIELLEAGFVKVEDEEDGVMYVWPYFAAYPIDSLEPRMKVELFRLITGGDYEEMQEFGAYVFYRIGIGADGRWRFFLSGDG